MNLQIFIQEKNYIKFALIFLFSMQANAWDVDFSRRAKYMDRQPSSLESSTFEMPAPKVLQKIFPASASHEIVIINTDKGFVPSKIHLKKGQRYEIHVVNVNSKEKNISFILDSFAQHFGTFYGRTKTFVVEPKQEGVFSYISPEVAAEGQIVVVGDKPELRLPASTGK